MKITAPILFATARGIVVPGGNERCWYCGAACDQSISADDWVKPTCTVRQYVAAPDSQYVCAGCAEALSERTTVQVFAENQPRQNKRVRCFSWIITRYSAIAYTKAHTSVLADICCRPPATPFAIVLSDSGQRHLIYLAPVNHSANVVSLVLEDERIDYRPIDLAERLKLTRRLAAAAGKPSLAGKPGLNLYLACDKHFHSVEAAEQWAGIWSQPLSRLAAWLTPGKEECRNDNNT